MRYLSRKIILGLMGLFFLGSCVISAFAQNSNQKPDIRLEVFSDGNLQPVMAQDWGAALNGLGFRGVQVRSGDGSDQLDILDLGANSYKVYAMLTNDNRLLLPGNYYVPRSRVREIYPYLVQQIELSKKSAPEASPESTLPGLENFVRELAKPVGFSTLDERRSTVLQKLLRSLNVPTKVPAAIRDVLDSDDRVTEELETVSQGTALAYLLRYIGYYALPEKAADGKSIQLRLIESADAEGKNILPVGYPVENPADISILNERFNANVNGVDAAKILRTLSKRLNMPILYDYNSMAGEGIELSDVIIKQKPGNFTYDRLIGIVLYQAMLQHEIRKDEAGNAFIWVTTFKKVQ